MHFLLASVLTSNSIAIDAVRIPAVIRHVICSVCLILLKGWISWVRQNVLLVMVLCYINQVFSYFRQ